MLISHEWLKQFINGADDLSPEKIGEELKMKTVEVEKITSPGKDLGKIVVGRILKIEAHPGADRLKVCAVDVGSEKINVVCGGSNLSENMNVIVAKLGAKVKWHGEGELIEMVRTKIRGVESEGMICASDEVGLAEMFPKKSEKEIVDLGNIAAATGTPIAEMLGLNDTTIEVDNKSMSHRSDLWGHYGIAREVAAIFKKDLQSYKTKKIKEGNSFDLQVEVKDVDLCPRYMAVALEGIKIMPSPTWLQKRLSAVGLRPINNIVDITNYLMLELGQPMHAFDAARLNVKIKMKNSKFIFVRRAQDGEKIKALDEKEYELTNEMLVIADEEKALAIAGVIGGEGSGVSDETKTIVFEVATFNASSIRKTSTKLGLRTDSSARFEKSLDPANAELALKRAVELVMEFCPEAKVSSKVIDINNYPKIDKEIIFPVSEISGKIGVAIPTPEAIDILTRLGFGVKENKDILKVKVPSWRATKDVSIAEDLVEEIIRMYGFNNIPSTLPVMPTEPPEENKLRTLERKIKDLLIREFSFTDVYNYSFENEAWLKKVGFSVEGALYLDNPMTKDRQKLRQSLLPNLLQTAETNLHETDDLKVFEIGRVFDGATVGVEDGGKGNLPQQNLMLAAIYSKKENQTPFFTLSEALRRILQMNGVSPRIVKEDKAPDYWHGGRVARIEVAGKKVGMIGELHPAVQERIGLPYRASMLEIDMEKVLPLVKEVVMYKPISAFPQMTRDVAFVVDSAVVHTEIYNALRKVSNLIVGVELFDVFAGKNMPDGKKSMAYHIIYESAERTLESAEVDAAQTKIFALLQEKFQAEIRK